MDATVLIPIILFIGVALLVSAIFYFIRSWLERRKLMQKIKQTERSFAGKQTGNALSTTTIVKLYQTWIKQSFLKVTGTFGSVAKPEQEKEFSHIQKMLLTIGYRSRNMVMIFFGTKVLCAVLLPAGFSFLKLFIQKPVHPLFLILFFLGFALAGFNLPNLWLRIKVAKRKERILEGFPDALDLLVVCTEAGMGLDAAIDRVGEEMKLSNEAISEEFRLYQMEVRIGKSRTDALKSLSSRTDLDDMKSLVTLLIQTDKFGTSVAQALRIHSDTMRIQRYQMAEEKAAKLTVKLLLPLILCIFPSLFIVILGPALIQAFRIYNSR
ncbi:MAG: type II secretion system F family protein [Candidatus Jettenia sp. CY-1]|nr:MAG: type II secretion system F family protein [Candidatus Jettenia sp. CY-1]